MTRTRGTSNGNATGSAEDRRRRRQHLLTKHGDGEICPCYRCGVQLDFQTMTVDRIIAGMDGGTYARDNVRPACSECNIKTGNQLRDHRVKFPKGSPVVFARNRNFFTHDKVIWDIVDGESEALLTVRSRATGRRRFNISRNHLLAVSA